MRLLISSYLGATEWEPQYAATHYGKPVLLAPYDYLNFNLSHTNGCAILAVSSRIPVGVDVEADTSFPFDFAREVFGVNELNFLEGAAHKERVFLSLWTRKEAFLKALGSGLSIEPKYIEVSTNFTLGMETPVAGIVHQNQHWSVFDMPVIENAAASLVAGSDAKIVKTFVLKHWLRTQLVTKFNYSKQSSKKINAICRSQLDLKSKNLNHLPHDRA